MGVTDVAQVFELKKQTNSATCTVHNTTLLKKDAENGYPTMLWSETCETRKEKTTVLLSKVILGNDRLYVVSKIWTQPPKDRQREHWLERLNDMYVCDPTSSGNPCTWLRDRDNTGRPNGRRSPRGAGTATSRLTNETVAL